MTGKNLLLIIAPLIVLQIILLVAAMLDLVKRDKVTGGNKVIWALVIIFISTIGPIVYFIFGRNEDNDFIPEL